MSKIRCTIFLIRHITHGSQHSSPAQTFILESVHSLTVLSALQKACEEIPSLEKQIAAGNFKPLRDWLKVKIHQVGSLHPNGDELMKAVTGSPLDPSVFLKYLRTKYTALYNL